MLQHKAKQLQAPTKNYDVPVGLEGDHITFNSPCVTSSSRNPLCEESKDINVLLCGCGNAVHVLTSYLGDEPPTAASNTTGFAPAYKFKVNILSLCHSDRLLTSVLPDGYIRCSNDMGADTLGKADNISSNPALVVPGCNLILFALPTDRHELYLRAMLPYIEEGTIIGAMPGEGGFDICVRDVLGSALADKCTFFSTETLPWACRIQKFGQVVQVLGTKKDIDLCVYPSDQCWKIRDLMQSMIGRLPLVETSPTYNFLGSTLMNPNGIAHPTILYGLLRNWDGVTPFSHQPLFYQAIDDFTANMLEAVSHEILQVKEAVKKLYPSIDLADVRSIGEFFEVAYGKSPCLAMIKVLEGRLLNPANFYQCSG